MKNKKLIIGFILGAIIASGITAYATGYLARDIAYSNNKSVEDALNELYSKNTSIIIDNSEKLTQGVKYEDDYYCVFSPFNYNIIWNEAEFEMSGYEKIILCHKTSGNNGNFTATLPFNVDNKTLDVKLIKQVGNSGWNPSVIKATGNEIDIDVNYGTPELSEYYFYVTIK